MRIKLRGIPALARALLTSVSVTVVGCGDSAVPTSSSSPTSAGQETCLARAAFGDPALSAYVLPYPVGGSFLVSQSYCNPNGGHRDTFAYDFRMPMGAPITASRSGVVIIANDQFADNDNVNGNENNVFVQHDDGTVVRYTHLQQGSVVVAVGDSVTRGQRLGSNGASGNSGGVPHLHLEAFASRSFQKSNAIPINFRNAGGQPDTRGGLAAGRSYEALPF